MKTYRMTAAQAFVNYLMQQKITIDEQTVDLFAGVFAIFGHGNVTGIGEALYGVKDHLTTYRGQNEQSMAHAAIAYAKATNRRQIMACTSSIGPGATNMVTACALAHANRLPVLFVPGDVFANRRPDPVLQQIEDFSDATVTVNDCFRPVSRYFDRITKPEQIITSLPRAIATMLDPTTCGPATIAFCQDVQTMAYDYPQSFFEEKTHKIRRQLPCEDELQQALDLIRTAENPLIIAGGGVHASLAFDELVTFASAHGIPVAETQAGKGAIAWDHPLSVGGIGVTGSEVANTLAKNADVILAVGTRLQDFTTGSRALFAESSKIIQLNVCPYDAIKHNSICLIGDAKLSLQKLQDNLDNYSSTLAWNEKIEVLNNAWQDAVDSITAEPIATGLPTDAQVLGAVNRFCGKEDIVVCAAGGLPGELHKLWRTSQPQGYHVEYGYSCMGYEIAGGLGVKMAHPDKEVYVMVGDGSYLMMNSEIITSVLLEKKLTIILLDNGGFGCINRLQQVCGNQKFNNLIKHNCDFVAHAAAMGANAIKASNISQLTTALTRAKANDRTTVILIETDPEQSTAAGGSWWDVAIPEISQEPTVNQARLAYEQHCKQQKVDG